MVGKDNKDKICSTKMIVKHFIQTQHKRQVGILG